MKARIDNIEHKLGALTNVVEARGKNHDRNNEAFKEITSDYNKMMLDKERLQDKVYKMEIEQAVQNSTVARVFTEIVDIKKDVKGFMDKIVAELTIINTSINNTQTRDDTIWGFVKLLVQASAPTILMIISGVAILKGLGKL